MAKLVIVNENDEELGLEDAAKCHLGKGILHRALTVFIFNSENKLLIQKRSKSKLLWPLTWESSCSSHPLSGEDYIMAGKKCVKREIGVNCNLEILGKFQYQAKYRDVGSENEVCALLVGFHHGDIRPNSEEIAEWVWVDHMILTNDLDERSEKYAPWLRIALRYYKNSRYNI